MHISVEYSTREYTIPIVPKSTGIISENTFNVSIYPAGIPRMNGRADFIYFMIRLFPFFRDQCQHQQLAYRYFLCICFIHFMVLVLFNIYNTRDHGMLQMIKSFYFDL